MNNKEGRRINRGRINEEWNTKMESKKISVMKMNNKGEKIRDNKEGIRIKGDERKNE